MDKENYTHVHTHTHHEILFSLNKEGNPAIYRFMDEPEGHYAKWNKPDRDRQVLYDTTYVLRKKKKKAQNRMGFPGGSVDKESACNAGDLGLIPGLGGSLEKGMATHSSILAWRIPWTEEPGRLQFMGWQRVGHTE